MTAKRHCPTTDVDLYFLQSQAELMSVDFEDAEDVWGGGGVAHSVQSEGRSRQSLELRALVQSEQPRHLAGLQEVEVMWSSRRGGPIAFHALQLLRPLTHCHHIQLHILRLLLVKQHLTEEEVDASFLHGEGAQVFVVPHGLGHVQRPLLPAFDDASVAHLLRGHFGDFKMRRRFLPTAAPPAQRPPVSLDSLADQQLSLLQNELNDSLPLCINLLEPILQDFKGLGQVSRLAPGPRREERTAGGQGQRHECQRSPDEPQLTHPSPLHDPMHAGGRRLRPLTLRCRPSRSPSSSSP